MKLLIVEDEKKTGEYLTKGLTEAGFVVDLADNGLNGYHLAMTGDYDLIILDIMLPDVNGWDIVRMLRAASKGMPVLLLTALGTVEHRVKGLELGADDYLVKPFAFEELLARIQCMVRRPGRWEDTAVLSLGDLIFDPESGRLEGNGKECTLSKREGALLELMLRNAGQTLPREVILNRVWGADSEVEDGNLDNYIHFLRRRLKSVRSTLNLKTVRGIGYRLEN